MTEAVVKLPLSQLSPPQSDARLLSVERCHQDVLLNDILNLRAAAGFVATQPTPVLTPQDRNPCVERMETLLEGEAISCFEIGGEKRLCFPQILNVVLRDIRLPEINRAFTDLNVHCSRCSPGQLEVLKVTGIMPLTADSCGLITKSDAERLVSTLQQQRKQRPRLHLSSTEHLKKAFPVVHDCFGGARGSFVPDLYRSPAAECIECSECREVFAPDRFVCHTHREGAERGTCHWGFDSANWRSYLHLPLRAEDMKDCKQALSDMKQRFDPVTQAASLSGLLNLKRTAEQAALPTLLHEGQKRLCVVDAPLLPQTYLPPSLYEPTLLNAYCQLLNKSARLQVPTLLSQLPNRTPTPNKAAEAAAGLLALSEKGAAPRPTPSRAPPTEPLKKHLLHQFEEEQRRSSDSPVSVSKERPESGDTSTASETDEEPTLDSLLKRHVPDKEALSQIRAKIADSQRTLETKLDSLASHNHILQQEIAYLRNRQSNVGGASMVNKLPPGLLLGSC